MPFLSAVKHRHKNIGIVDLDSGHYGEGFSHRLNRKFFKENRR